MAEQALKKLKDQLNCPICLDTYTDPKQLQCNHVCCLQCLVRLVFRDQQGQLILTCPNCRQVTPVPASGVAGLQAAFQINQLLEIVKGHKKDEDAIADTERVKSAFTNPNPSGHATVGCPDHGGREVELYCETCEETICFRCIMTGEKHHSHNYGALERYKEVITSYLESMEKQLVTIKRALAQLDTCCEEISNQQATMEADIHDTFTQLHQTLDVRKTELISQLHQLTQDKLKSLAVQRDQIETTQAQLSTCLRQNLKTGNQGEALLMKSTTVRQVKELTTTFQPDLLEPSTDMIFSASADITAVIQNYGHVHKQGSPDPSKCTASGKGVEEAAVGERSTVLLQTLGFDSVPSKATLHSIMCELVSEMTGTRVGGSVERRGQGQYEISYQPTIKGRHQLHIKVEGQRIRGSPFPVTAKLSDEKFDAPILTIGGIKGPEGVVVNQRGEVIVVEMDAHCVTVLSPSGKRLLSFGSRGSRQGQFEGPRGVAVDGEGCILVTDDKNHRIQKFTPDGRFLKALGSEGNGAFKLSNPRGIAYNPSNDKVYIVDWNDHVQILNSDLSYSGSFGKKGTGKGHFNNPQYLACDRNGKVYVADYKNNRIQVFTAKGKFLRMFGRCGQGRGELWGPCGLAVDSSGKVYVSEFSNHRVSVFTSEGQFVTAFGSKGNSPEQFYKPTGLAACSGVVYVCDYDNNRIQIL